MLAKFQGVWLIQAFFSRRAKTQGKKMKLKQFFLKTQAIFSKKKKLKKPEIFEDIKCQVFKINHHMDSKCHF